ncbi:MAG: hypothetical protein KIS67_27620 [Verrucomicrobiae bacterium]|nr:hypothetical protein [Verrucomicrobiae bacterium]
MNTERPAQSPTRKPFVLRWLVWGVLLLIGGTIVAAVVSAFVDVARYGVDPRKLPFLIAIVIWFVLFFCLKAATNPIRGRSDERRSWREKFPSHTEQEIERFLRVVGDSLLTSEKHRDRLRPDDTVASLTQEWLCGDGMDIIEFIMAVEEEYGLELPESFLERAQTLGDFFAYVTQHSAPKPPPSAPEQPAPTEDA